MAEHSLSQRMAGGPAWTGRRQVLGRLARLATKELREILRDRRTIVTLFVMPLLLYPLVAIVFQRFLVTSLPSDAAVEYVIGVDSRQPWRQLAGQIERGNALLRRQRASETKASTVGKEKAGADSKGAPAGFGRVEPDSELDQPLKLLWVELPSEAVERHVTDATVHLAAVPMREDRGAGKDGLGHPLTWMLYYRKGSPTSEAALRYVETRLHAFNESQLDEQLKELGVAASFPASTARHPLDFSGAPIFSLAALIPLILVLMTVTGAVYPAIDLTAGERERGTLEMLIAAPVPRLGLLLAKYVAVLTVAILTALVNLVGMAITSHSTGLNATLFGGEGLSLPVVIKVLLLLCLFAAFFSAVLLAITSYARSFKEAQAYIIPLMLLCLVPGIVCLMPSLAFSGTLAVTPLVNIVLLARDLLEGSVDPRLAAAAVCSTLVYVMAAIALAAKIFGTDAILYGSSSSWSDIFRRPNVWQRTASVPAALFALALIFPSYFVLGSELAHAASMSMQQKLIASGLVTVLVFLGIPLAIAVFNRVRLESGFSLERPNVAGFVAALLFGVSLWPMAHELVLLAQKINWFTLGPEQVASVKLLLQEWKDISPALILIVLAVVAGVCEELAFRGFFFASLERVLSPWATILTSALLFGVMHEALAPGRFLPSTFLGVVFGWVRSRTGSVWPCIVIHVVHNGLLLSMACWQDELAARGFGVEEATHLPATWLLAAAGGIAAAVTILLAKTTAADRRTEVTASVSASEVVA